MIDRLQKIARFLQAARNLAKQGIKQEEVMEFAKQEFGEVNDLLKRQIEQIFTPESGGITSIRKPEGDVIDVSFKPGMDKKGNVVEESPSQRGEGISIDQESFLQRIARKIAEDREQSQKKQGIEKLVDEGEGIEFSIPSQGIIKQKGSADEIMNYLSTNPYRKGGPLDPRDGITRTAARTILRKLLDEGKIKIPDETERKAIAEGYQGGVDPIVVFEKVFGRENLDELADLADEMNRAGDYTELEKILQREKFFDLKQKDKYEPDPFAMSDDELRQFLKDKGVDPDDTGFAKGGRVGYRLGSGLKLAKYLAIRGKTLKDEILKAVDNFIQPSGDKKYDADVILDDMLEELGTSRDEIDQKDIIDAYGDIYDTLTKGPKTLDEALDMKSEKLAPKMMERFRLKEKYPGIDEDLLTQIIDDPNPQNKAEALATLDQSMELMKSGKSSEEVIDILTQAAKGRKDNADGGLNYLSGF